MQQDAEILLNTKVVIMCCVVTCMEQLRWERQLNMEEWLNGKLAEVNPRNLQRTLRKVKFVKHKSQM
jgi:hypothetical protein